MKNTVIVILIIVIVCLLLFGYYNYNNNKQTKPKKKVRFNDNIQKNVYPKLKSISEYSIDHFSSVNEDSVNSSLNTYSLSNSDSLRNSDESTDSGYSDGTQEYSENSVQAYGQNNSSESEWDAQFGVPLLSKQYQEKFKKGMLKKHQNYGNSLDEYTKYVMDNESMIEPNEEINPKDFYGKTIQEVYDKQTARIKPKNKKIKYQNSDITIYEDENEMNGGKMKGTNVTGFNGASGKYKSADFANEF